MWIKTTVNCRRMKDTVHWFWCSKRETIHTNFTSDLTVKQAHCIYMSISAVIVETLHAKTRLVMYNTTIIFQLSNYFCLELYCITCNYFFVYLPRVVSSPLISGDHTKFLREEITAKGACFQKQCPFFQLLVTALFTLLILL